MALVMYIQQEGPILQGPEKHTNIKEYSPETAGEPLHVHWLEWQIELALRRHGENRNRELIDDIVKTYKALIDE